MQIESFRETVTKNLIDLLHIHVSDLRKLYSSQAINPTVSPQTLQDKVQFDIRFYFIRRANENIDQFTKKTFVLEVDPNTGLKYIRKEQDQQTKNHQDDTIFVSGIMPELPNSDRCPVNNFMTYVSKLHPRCDYLWQQVKKMEEIKDADIWFKPCKIGPNPLSSFMSRLSDLADLSKVYTNHSIRVTGTTFLGRCNFSDKQIMAVTGHRSINSLSVYKKVSDDEKIMMGMAMTSYLHETTQPIEQQKLREIAPRPVPSAALGIPTGIENTVQQQEKVQQTAQAQITEKPTSKEIIQYEPEDPLLAADFNEDLNFDVCEMLNEIEKSSIQYSQVDKNSATCTTIEKQTTRRSPKVPIFQNCRIGSIGNIHLHIHKN